MKTCLSLWLLAVALCGCGESERITKLHQRLSKLESDVNAANSAIEGQTKVNETVLETLRKIKAGADNLSTNITGLRGDLTTTMGDVTTTLLDLRADVDMLKSNRPPVKTVYTRVPQPARPSQPAGLKSGVPAAIYDKIATEAAREWPGNFSMQKFQIEHQVEDYLKLNRR